MNKRISKTVAILAMATMLCLSSPALAGEMGDETASNFRSAPIPVTFTLGVSGFVIAVIATVPTLLTNFRKVDDLYEDMSFGFFRAMVSPPYEN